MKLNDTVKVQEVVKREWLEEIIGKFPKHDFCYVPMLSDNSLSDRETVVENFTKNFEDKDINVHVYHETKKYDGNKKDFYFYDIYSNYYGRGKKDEIIFVDADKGFYQVDVNSTPKNFKEYIRMSDIDFLVKDISENSLIVVFQSVSSQRMEKGGNTQIENVEQGRKGLSNFMIGKNYLWYKSPNYTDKKLKFYFFSKKDWSEELA
jgi:hypothetical protein